MCVYVYVCKQLRYALCIDDHSKISQRCLTCIHTYTHIHTHAYTHKTILNMLHMHISLYLWIVFEMSLKCLGLSSGHIWPFQVAIYGRFGWPYGQPGASIPSESILSISIKIKKTPLISAENPMIRCRYRGGLFEITNYMWFAYIRGVTEEIRRPIWFTRT